MPTLFEPRILSAWIDGSRLDRAQRVLSDPRLRLTRIGSPDRRILRDLAARFDAEPFDDLRQLAVATPEALWIDRGPPLSEHDCDALAREDIALVTGSCTLSFLRAVPQCETAPSFRRTSLGRAAIGIAEAFGQVSAFQATVAVPDPSFLDEGLRVAAASALTMLGPIDHVCALGSVEGTITASVVGPRGLGTIAVAFGIDAASYTIMGEGGVATLATGLVSWRRRDGSWVEQTTLEPDGDEAIIRTLLEAERPAEAATGSHAERGHRRARLRIAALCDAVRLSTRTAHNESVDSILSSFGVDPETLECISG